MQLNLQVMSFPGGSDGKESACSSGDLGQENPLEKGMATHSSILAWRIPRTEEPGGLQSMGSGKGDTTAGLPEGRTDGKKPGWPPACHHLVDSKQGPRNQRWMTSRLYRLCGLQCHSWCELRVVSESQFSHL